MRVHVLASTTTDNWFYLLEAGGEGLLVDPVDAAIAVGAVRAAGVPAVRVVNTHWHWDHTGGNAAVVEALGCEVWAPAASAGWGLDADVRFAPGDTLRVGGEPLRVLGAPGHTMDHVILADDSTWISGDVLFAGGIGNVRFGGDVGASWETAQGVVQQAAGHIRWYPGHDYAAGNAAFGLSVMPGDEALQALAARAAGRARADGLLSLTLQEERAHNLFLRTHDPAVQRAADAAASAAGLELPALPAGVTDAELAFRQLRALRDRWS